MTKGIVTKIFERHGFPVFFAKFEKVKLKNKTAEKSYKTVFLTYLPYFYEPESGQTLCRYAAIEDYHKYIPRKLSTVKKELEEAFPNNFFDIFTDNSPIDEKLTAEITGLGVRGKNTLIITEDNGSYIFLAEIISDLEIDCDEHVPSTCIGCGKCEKACPAGALKDGKCDITRCISALTQKKGELTEDEKELIIKNGLIWGCDRCQEVCPMNRELSESEYSKESVKLKTLTLEDIEGLTDKEFRLKYSDRAFTWRGLATIKRNIELTKGAKK